MLIKQKMLKEKIVRKTAIILLWLVIWQIVSVLVGNKVLFASPLETLKALAMLCVEADFVKILLVSSLKLILGFMLGLLAGGILGCIGAKKKWVRECLHPLLAFMKSVPVAAFVVMLLVWWGSKWLSVAIVFVVVFPHIYMAFQEGLLQVDLQMLEVAKVFGMHSLNKTFYLYKAALKPFLANGLKLSFGLSWKSGVAAEVIGTPDFSIGEALYMAKTHLNTSEVFAWIAVILMLSSVCEKVGLWLFEGCCNLKPRCRAPKRREEPANHETNENSMNCTISKSYGNRAIWDKLELTLAKGEIYTIQAPSGRGKTTLLRILAGLEKNDSEAERVKGAMDFKRCSCSMLFQEDRLLFQETPLTNIEMCIGSQKREEIWKQLTELIPELEKEQTCAQLSGGMRRRVGLIRAMMAEGELVLLDEPFAGLDEDTKKLAIDYILKMQRGRTILVVTHQENDAKMLNSTHFNM